MTSVTFTPSRPQPFTLEQAMQLEVDMLIAEISRLENSVKHLLETQGQLDEYLREDPDGDEDGEFARAAKENEDTIASQRERITLIKVAMLNKVGEGGMRHLGLDPGPAIATESSRFAAGAEAISTNVTLPANRASVQEDEGGLHL